MNRLLPFVLLSAFALPACSPAHDGRMNGGNMNMAMPADGDSDATRGYKLSMTKMMDDMPAFTGNVDADFMKQMRGHHQAAISMAEVEIANGDDQEAKQLAETIISDQRAEIELIDAWLSKNGE